MGLDGAGPGSFDLAGEVVEGAVVGDHGCGVPEFFFGRPLGGNAQGGLFVRHAA